MATSATSKRSEYLVVVAILIAVGILRLVLALKQQQLSYDSYFHLRQVQHIIETGVPLFNDPLSYGGRFFLFLPVFHYLVSIPAMIFPLEIVAIVVSNGFYLATATMIYFIAKRISKRPAAALFAFICAALLPISFTTNSFRPLSFVCFLIFTNIYFYLNVIKNQTEREKLESKKVHLTRKTPYARYSFIACSMLLSLTSPIAAVLFMTLLFYLGYSKIQENNIYPVELELLLLTLLFFIWSEFLFFKQLLLESGLGFIQLNIPPKIIGNYFPSISIPLALVVIGVLPFLAAIISIYHFSFSDQSKEFFLIICISLSMGIITWLRIIPYTVAITFVGFCVALLFAQFYDLLLDTYHKMKISSLENNSIQRKKLRYFRNSISVILALLIIPSLLIPAIQFSLNQQIPQHSDIAAMQWLAKYDTSTSGAATLLKEGSMLSYFSKHANLMDGQFLLIKDVEKRYEDLQTIYSSKFSSEVLRIMQERSINFILISATAANSGIPTPTYLQDMCFVKIYDEQGASIFERVCDLEEQEF